uniref:glutathione transferase n=1 Tax=Caenorhabditis japonica TaxID=281687 RepID=A0A8R1IN84_CAEJA
MVHYKLTYFPTRGLAEVSRQLFQLAGVEFEDERLPKEEFLERKDTYPFKQVPVLSVDGHQIPQSVAIARYLGNKFEPASKMRTILFLSVLALISCCTADSGVLRPCFERYPNHRLVNVMPYHSEWRMRSEDMCLLFCAQSASRCRSIVYDTVQHICHYFSDEGVDQAVISAKMTYLRVVSKSCL